MCSCHPSPPPPASFFFLDARRTPSFHIFHQPLVLLSFYPSLQGTHMVRQVCIQALAGTRTHQNLLLPVSFSPAPSWFLPSHPGKVEDQGGLYCPLPQSLQTPCKGLALVSLLYHPLRQILTLSCLLGETYCLTSASWPARVQWGKES